MPYILGVDLGTTNTAVAVFEGGRPRVIEDERGYKVLPSVLSAKGEGRFVVGQAAHNLILTRPERTVYVTKRLIGRRFDSSEVQRVIPRVGYAVQEAEDGGVQVQVGDSWMTPQEVAAVVLQVARGIAEKAVGEPVEEAVITVPAHFNHAQRKATLEAAELAGLKCERLLSEPTAAALAYGHRKNVDRTLVIFDLGGGTFDVSVLRLSGGIYETLSTNGDTFLGGEDFDYRLVDHLADEFKLRTGIDLRGDREALQRLKDAAERAKCELSFSDRATVVVAHAAPGQNLEATLTRVQLEAITADLVERCVDVARDAVEQAGIGISDVDEVILVGGQTRMPRVREVVSGLFGREPSRSVHPEEVVAIGAAVHAGTLGEVEGAPAILLDVTPFDLGIDSAGGVFTRIVPRNARIPCSETRTFATAQDEQTSVRITVRQGESRVSEENEFLGEFHLEGLTPAPRMETKVAVTFRLDANGMLHVTAVEPATGEKRHIAIRNYADRTRSTVGGGAAVPAGTPVPTAIDPKVKKKPGLFDSLFGSGKKGGKPSKMPAPQAAAGSAAAGTAAAASTPPTVAALEPPPTIAALPTPAPLSEDDVPDAVLAEVEPDEASPFEMPDELGEENLYDAATVGPASFGLAGAPQVGAADLGGDPFADLGAPAPPPRRPTPAADPFAIAESAEPAPFAAEDLFADVGLDASDLFGEEPDDDEDPPTDPGLTHAVADAPAAPPPEAAADTAPPVERGLLFEGLMHRGAAPEDPFDPAFAEEDGGDAATLHDDEIGFTFDPPATAPVSEDDALDAEAIDFSFAEGLAEAAALVEAPPVAAEPFASEPTPAADAPGDTEPFGFSVGAPLEQPPVAPQRARAAESESTEIFRRDPLAAGDDDAGFEFPTPQQEALAGAKKRKPARVKLAYRDRKQLVEEYRENLARGGARIRTEKPLATGRECVFEVTGPGLLEPLVIPARVVRGLPDGMEVEYDLDQPTRLRMLASLDG